MTSVIEELKKRKFIEAVTSDDISSISKKPLSVYCGFDPTDESLHLGNMVAMMGLAWFQRFGHTPVILIGGATGMIGDPSGKSKERNLLDLDVLKKNIEGITKDLKKVLDFDHPTCKPIIVNNYDWLKDFSFIDFLREVGKYFRVGPMLAKESVRARLNSEEGISFTEFSYQLMQGYDFLYLFLHHNVTMQLGGSDQWGNITGGIDLIRRVCQKQAYGVTFPLLTTSDGKKFGKSEGGAIYLSEKRLSPYQFYQYLFRVRDDDVIKLLSMLTFMEMDEIDQLAKMMKSPDYVPNTVQKRLAEVVTRMVHGEKGLKKALEVTDAAKPGSHAHLDADTLENIAHDMPTCTLDIKDVENIKLVDLLVKIELQKSKGESRRLIQNGGCYLNNEKILDVNYEISIEDLIDKRLMLIAAGKKNKMLIRIKAN